ncbi:MAG: NADPH-dependent F420 reductase [Chloroflexota bacterium]|nr:NADPH-dependent F420 reductase [Chloroflexota bacterium]MDE2884712.1 NADPH-dependent F420 reductase [Chloroflexota bacterium]
MTRIAIVGGTGPEGRGLAMRLAMAGHEVVIGSRDAGRAADAASGLLEGRDTLPITGAANADAVSEADVVLLAVPFEGLRPTAEALRQALAGRLVVSIVAPVEFADGQMRALTVPEGSAGELTRDLLPESRVAAAFQNMSARDLLRADHPLEGDVAVTADDESARRETMALAEAMPSLRAVDAGPLSNSRYVEELTALLVNLNRIHKAHSTIRFLGL